MLKGLAKYMNDTKNFSFIGVEARQWHSDIWLWEKFFNKHSIASLVELGTGSGGLSLFFILQSIQHSFNFWTFDIEKPAALKTNLGKTLRLEDMFTLGNIFKDKFALVSQLIKSATRPLLLYCDDGDKPREVKTFGAMLQPGDFVAVHDWGYEIFEKDIPAYLDDDCTPLETVAFNSKSRWFEVRKT